MSDFFRKMNDFYGYDVQSDDMLVERADGSLVLREPSDNPAPKHKAPRPFTEKTKKTRARGFMEQRMKHLFGEASKPRQPSYQDMPLDPGFANWLRPRPDDTYERGRILPFAINERTNELSWGVPQVGVSALQAVTAPGRAMRGEFDPLSDQGIAEAVNLAGFATGGRFGVGATRTATPIVHRGYFTYKLARELAKDSPQTMTFGKITKDRLKVINEIRALEGQPPIGTRQARIYQGVLKKWQEKRIREEKRTPKQVAQTAYRTLYDDQTSVERGDYKTSHALINEHLRPPAAGFVGRGPKDDVSYKTNYNLNQHKIDKLREKIQELIKRRK